MDFKREIVKTITGMAGKYPAITIFEDWVCCSALAVQNGCQIIHDSVWQKREEHYLNVMMLGSKAYFTLNCVNCS